MIFLTHIKIGKMVHSSIADSFGIKLNKLAFVYGNIYPDLNPKIRHNKHNMDDCLFEVEKYLAERSKSSNFKKSFRLGAICHYVTDSFCAAHLAPEVYNTRRKHIWYEMQRTPHLLSQLGALNIKKLMPIAGSIGRYRENVQSMARRAISEICRKEGENAVQNCLLVSATLLAT